MEPQPEEGVFAVTQTFLRKRGAKVPILTGDVAEVAVDQVANPLTQILMLTAIVVGVATLGVGLALAQKIYRQHASFDEDEILENQRK